MPAETRSADDIPKLRGIGLAYSRDPYGTVLAAYRRYGPVFRMRVVPRKLTMLVGREANLACSRLEPSHLKSELANDRLARAFHQQKMILSTDGEEHRTRRRAFAPAFQKSAVGDYLPAVHETTERYLTEWCEEGSRHVKAAFKQLAFKQLAAALSPEPADDEYPALNRFIRTAMYVGGHVLPESALRWPRNRRAFEKVTALTDRIRHGTSSGRFLLVDLVREAIDADVLAPEEWRSILLLPYLAGLNTTGGMLTSGSHELAHRPEVVDRIRRELSASRNDSAPTLSGLEETRSLAAFTSECLRLHSDASLTIRGVSESFDFAGKRIREGSLVGFCPALPHYMKEYFPSPQTFDIDRWIDAERPPPGAYQPYGVGRHVCMGNGIANMQLLVTFSMLAGKYRVVPERPDQPLRKAFDPLYSPVSFRARLVRA